MAASSNLPRIGHDPADDEHGAATRVGALSREVVERMMEDADKPSSGTRPRFATALPRLNDDDRDENAEPTRVVESLVVTAATAAEQKDLVQALIDKALADHSPEPFEGTVVMKSAPPRPAVVIQVANEAQRGTYADEATPLAAPADRRALATSVAIGIVSFLIPTAVALIYMFR